MFFYLFIYMVDDVLFEQQMFANVYKEYFSVVYRVIYAIVYNKEACEEICQETFIKYYQHIDRLSADATKPWLITVGKNLAINYAKRKGREYMAYNKVLLQPNTVERTAESDVIREEESREVILAIKQLPRRFREALILRTYGDLNYREVARVLGISDANAKVRVYRARIKLAEILKRGKK